MMSIDSPVRPERKCTRRMLPAPLFKLKTPAIAGAAVMVVAANTPNNVRRESRVFVVLFMFKPVSFLVATVFRGSFFVSPVRSYGDLCHGFFIQPSCKFVVSIFLLIPLMLSRNTLRNLPIMFCSAYLSLINVKLGKILPKN